MKNDRRQRCGQEGNQRRQPRRTRWHYGAYLARLRTDVAQAAACKSAVSSSGMSICAKCVQGSVRTVQPDRDFSFS